MIAFWWPGQIWFTHLLIGSCRYLILGDSSLILNPGKEMMKMKEMLPPGKIAAFLMDQTMGVFDDWMKEKNYTIEDIMHKKMLFIRTEFMTWQTRTSKTKPSSAKHHASILNTMLSLIFGTVLVSAIVQRLTTHAISNHQINNPRYESTWDINQLFEHWRERPESKLLSNEELQVMPTSLQMSLYFVRMEEMANIDLSVSIIDDEEHTAAVCIPPKQSVQKERYDVRKTEEPKVCPTETFFVWLTRLREHFQQSPTNIIHLFWTENWKRADQRYISTRLEGLVQTLG
ncbi:MAG: hypothetical protein EZS28_049543, partial [Streblomastix strix]